MRFVIAVLSIFLFFSSVFSGSQRAVGTTQSVIEDIVKQNVRASSNYTLLSSSAEKLVLSVEDYYFKDGQLSMTGKAQNAENSMFIMKGSLDELYGWVLLRDRKIAYEYTTDENKKVFVEQVPVSKVFCIDDFPGQYSDADPFYPDFIPDRAIPVPHIGDYPGTDLNKLQSLPGAKKVLYMDITDIMNGTEPKSQTKDDVWKTWQSFASGYSMYEVNVTTDKAVYQAAGTPNSGIAKYYNQTGRSYSPVNAFGTTSSSTVYRQNNGYGTGRTGLHETGHLMGVYDYGGTGGTYFVGIKEFKWNTIMGNYWYGDSWGAEALYQWSKGEYTSANVKTDFLAIANKNLPFRNDDIPTSVPLKFTGASQITADNNYGQITPNTDSDDFDFEIITATGHAKLTISRIEYMGGGMLDVDASILDASGKVIVTNNPKAIRSASLDTDLPKGKYFLRIKGGAEGTPQNGFSNYSSLGYYSIAGEITGGGTAITPKNILANRVRIIPVFAGTQVKIDIPDECKIDKIALFSIDGKRKFYSDTRVNFIDFSDLGSGIYTIIIGIDGMNVVRKIIKK